jgi:hypothetical protein
MLLELNVSLFLIELILLSEQNPFFFLSNRYLLKKFPCFFWNLKVHFSNSQVPASGHCPVLVFTEGKKAFTIAML